MREKFFFCGFLMSLIMGVSAGAQQPVSQGTAASGSRLTAEEILEKALAATGGRAPRQRITSIVSKGTLEVVTQGLQGTIEIYAKAPNKMLIVQTIPGLEIKQGFDGQVGWISHSLLGFQRLEGAELAAFKRTATFQPELRWRELYEKIELVGEKKVGDRTAYVIRLTPAVGHPVTQYYDSETFRLLRTDTTQQGPLGAIAQESYPSDYREVEGVLVPFTLTLKTPTAVVVIHITERKTNVEIDDARFAPPQSAKAQTD